MSERGRNLAVGLTVIVALTLLGAMILIFAGMPTLLKSGYEIRILLDSTHELAEGDPVYLSGIRVGTITRIGFADPDAPGQGIVMVAKINQSIPIPGNTKAVVYNRGFAGKGYLQLNPEGPYPLDAQGHLMRFLPTDGSVVLRGEGRGSGLIPDEFRTALASIAELATNLNRLVAPPEPTAAPAGQTQPATATAPAGASLVGTIQQLNRALDAVTAVVGDPQNQQNIKASMANLAEATSQASAAMVSLRQFAETARQTAAISSERIDVLMLRLIEDAERFSELMATVNRAAVKVESGDGTAGQLINDPRLYNNMVEATAQLNRLVTQMQLLVESWQKEGVEFKAR